MYLMDHIDDIISAELPDPKNPKNKTLFEIVSKQMIHGPCGHFDPNCVCMVDGKCSKEFPKAFASQTDSNVNGYPKYKRRNNGVHFKKEITVNDQYNRRTRIDIKVIFYFKNSLHFLSFNNFPKD